jgi:hypothetical protein
MVSGLPVDVLKSYLAALDDTGIPVEGVYLTGSAVLDDWQPDSSDLDLLAVTPEPLDETGLAALEALHGKYPDRPYLDAVYVPHDSLGSREGLFPHVVDGTWRGATFHPNPVLWATLDSRGATLRGPSAQDLGTAPDPGWLREWNLENLRSYWQRRWAAFIRARVAELDLDSPVPGPIAWAALGPGRLHCTHHDRRDHLQDRLRRLHHGTTAVLCLAARAGEGGQARRFFGDVQCPGCPGDRRPRRRGDRVGGTGRNTVRSSGRHGNQSGFRAVARA